MSQSEKRQLETVATVGSKMARSCDSCVQQNARWYCSADDAFLCQHCDTSVHSANPLALRHHRLQLRMPTKISDSPESLLPAWHSGFTRKARTPRMHNKAVSPLVPEIETSKENNDDNEEELLYRVPIFNPVLAEFSSPAPFLDDNSNMEVKPPMTVTDINNNSKKTNDCLVGLLPSDMDLAEFAADIESLLGGGLDNESFSMEELGLGDTNCGLVDSHLVKEELDGEDVSGDIELYEEMDLSREVTREIKFDNWGSPTTEEEDDREEMRPDTKCRSRKAVGLRLDCEAIIAEWSSVQGSCSPWMNGKRPQFGPDDCWLDYMEKWGGGSQVQGVVQGEVGGGHIDERREARVSRYREKRRTRLFSKKIRYEVRKLNAEKRPRMKGRFVKRASFATPTPTEGLTFP